MALADVTVSAHAIVVTTVVDFPVVVDAPETGFFKRSLVHLY